MKHMIAGSYLEACPPEICFLIFTYACTDDGRTGRALSLVSRRIREVSKEVKLRSLAVVGGRQLVGCARMLQNLEPRFRRVRHLYLSGLGLFEKPTDTSMAINPVYGPPNDTYRAFECILQLVAPTLTTFTFISNIPRPTVLLPVSLPVLEQMSVWGMLPTHLSMTGSAMTPSLRNLSLIGFDDHPPELFEDIQCAAPALTQLTLKPMQYKRPLFDDLASIVGGDNLSRKRPSRRCTQDHSSSPNSITHTSSTWPPNYSVTDTPSGTSSPAPQPCPCSVSGNLLKHVKTINVQRSSAKPLRHSEHLCIPDKQLQALACRDSRLKILQPVKICPYNETKREWLKSQCMYF